MIFFSVITKKKSGFLPWLIIVLIVVGSIILSVLFVYSFRDPQESSKIPMIFSGIGVTITLVTICLIPLDVLTTANMIDPTIVGVLFKLIYFGNLKNIFFFTCFLIHVTIHILLFCEKNKIKQK